MRKDRNMLKNKKLTAAFLLFAVWLYFIWALMELWLYPLLEVNIQEKWLFTLLTDGLIKNLIWTASAIMLIKHFSSELHIGIRELFSFNKGCVKYTLFSVVLAAIVIAGAVIRRHGFAVNENFEPSMLITYLLVGISEETVFRGFFLNATLSGAESSRSKRIAALIINAVMFLCIHFPIWIRSGMFVSSFTGGGFVTVMLLSMLFGYTMIKCRSLLPAVIMHSVYDLAIAVFVMV